MGNLCSVRGSSHLLYPTSSLGSHTRRPVQGSPFFAGSYSHIAKEGGNRKGIRRSFPRFLQPPLSCSKERWFLQTGNRSFSSEQVYPGGTFQNGNPCFYQGFHSSGRLGSVGGFDRCLSAYPYPPFFQKVPPFCLPNGRVLVPRPSLWPFFGPQGVHQSYACRSSISQVQRHPDSAVPGRLAHPQIVPHCPQEGSQHGYFHRGWPSG